jgi:tetratricopeptide (TPR) repeat protein
LEQKNKLYCVLAEAYYYSGDTENEKSTLQTWEKITALPSYHFHIFYARFLRRHSAPTASIFHISKAIEKAEYSPDVINAQIELLKALWANGKIDEAYAKLKQTDIAFSEKIEQIPSLNISFEHACCLILHDLDKNKQVLQHAQKCMDKYEKMGDIQSLLISRVNYADALWGLGFVRMAEAHLKTTCGMADKYDLPHAKDIAYICYANVLTALNKFELASSFYKSGLELAIQIGHDWDEIYCLVYQNIYYLKAGETSTTDLKSLLTRCINAGYHYLADLVFGTICIEHTAQLQSVNDLELNYQPVLPVGKLFYLSNKIQLGKTDAQTVHQFLDVLGKCEGVKLDKAQILLTLEILMKRHFIDSEVYLEFARRWLNMYSPKIERNSASTLKACDYRTCEARCCYDGVYLVEGEENAITDIVRTYPEFFRHLPADFITDGTWGNSLKGRKTAVRQHEYISPDFPDHFERTRCVFSESDGACSLQTASMKLTNDPWTYKPKACQIHPLQTKNFEFFAPPKSIENDKYDTGINYAGYVSYTPCGIHRADGILWLDQLAREIEVFQSEGFF